MHFLHERYPTSSINSTRQRTSRRILWAFWTCFSVRRKHPAPTGARRVRRSRQSRSSRINYPHPRDQRLHSPGLRSRSTLPALSRYEVDYRGRPLVYWLICSNSFNPLSSLKYLPMTSMTTVETDRVSGQQPPHHSSYRCDSCSQQQMQMVRY